MLPKAMKHMVQLFGDFYILDVKRDAQTGLANKLLICQPRNFQPGASFWVNRADVIGLMEDGYLLELYPPEDQPMQKRWFVRLVEIEGKKYMRADNESIAADYLVRQGC